MSATSRPLPRAAGSRSATRATVAFAFRAFAFRALTFCALALLGATRVAADPPPFCDEIYLFIATSEYFPTAGAFTLMDMQPPWPHADSYDILSGDAIPLEYRGLIYVLDRANGNIQVIDPDQDFATVRQFSVGVSSNPQDLCFIDERRAFVTRYESTELWEVDPSTGQHTDTIDLAPLADADGLPEMNKMAVHGGRLFITLQRLDRDFGWLPVAPSLLAVVDLASNELLDMDPLAPGLQGLPLAGTNPNSGIVVDPRTGHFLIGELGLYAEHDGGVERFDPADNRSLGFVITEEALGGNLDVWNTRDGVTGYAIVLGGGWETSIVAFDLDSGTPGGTLIDSPEYAFSHFLIDPPRHQLFVSDRTYANPGVRVCDLETQAEVTSEPIPVGLYPYWLLELRGPDAAVPPGEGPRPALALRASPQPARGEVLLRLDSETHGATALEILDACGRPVARLAQAGAGHGSRTFRWNGRAADGSPVAAGTYWARAQAGGAAAATRICWIR